MAGSGDAGHRGCSRRYWIKKKATSTATSATSNRAFTDPDQLAAWWGPVGNSLPRDEIEFDVRTGGFQRWTEVAVAEPGLRIHIYLDLTDVADGELLDGIMHVTGQLQEGIEPFQTRFRVEFHEEAGGRTRLEVRQWLPEHLASPSEAGWLEAFTKLDGVVYLRYRIPA